MSQEDVEAVRQLVQAFNLRDLPAVTQWFEAEIEWMPGGPAAVERRVYRGLDEVSGGFATTWETWEEFRLEEHVGIVQQRPGSRRRPAMKLSVP